jgi:putative SOS response-associated peptidase YedK
MCNDFGNRIPYDDYLRAFSQTRIPVRLPSAAPNLEPRDDIWPTDVALVIRQTDEGHEFIQLRWGMRGPAASIAWSCRSRSRSTRDCNRRASQ